MNTLANAALPVVTASVAPPSQSPPLSPAMAGQLALLRDVHLPEAVAWWPLAPGWWFLGLLLVAGVLATCVVRRQMRRSLRRHALSELGTLERMHAAPAQLPVLATEIGQLLRRVALKQFGRQGVANLAGKQWADYLTAGKYGMPASCALYFSFAPYVSAGESAKQLLPQEANKEAIVDAAKHWIGGNV